MNPLPHFHEELDMIGKVKISGGKSAEEMRDVKDFTLGLTPLGKNVAVILCDDPKVTPGGVHLPDISKRRSLRAKVFAVGKEVTSLVKDDIVHLPDHGGSRIEVGTVAILFYSEDDILAKERKE